MSGKKLTEKSKHLLEFRETVQHWINRGKKQIEIAEKLGVSKANLHTKLTRASTLESSFYARFLALCDEWNPHL